MGETTKINKATTNSISLRTTIPHGVVAHLNLRIGDTLDWTLDAKKDDLIIRVDKAAAARRRK